MLYLVCFCFVDDWWEMWLVSILTAVTHIFYILKWLEEVMSWKISELAQIWDKFYVDNKQTQNK